MTSSSSTLCQNGCGNSVSTGPGRTGKFCSRSCANSFSNRQAPKRKPEGSCKNCGSSIPARRVYCSIECRSGVIQTMLSTPTSQQERRKTVCTCGANKNSKSLLCQECRWSAYRRTTLGELRSKSVRDAQVYNRLREVSRKISKRLGFNSCFLCGYDAHVEVCHINKLSDLSDLTTVEEAVGSHNFIVLCRNHHWELDHEILDLNDIPAPHLGFEPS